MIIDRKICQPALKKVLFPTLKDCHQNTEIVLVGMEKMDLFLDLLDIQIIVKETQNPMNELAQMLDVSVIVVVYRRIYL